MANTLPEAELYNGDKYVTAKQIPGVLSHIGIERGFSKASLYFSRNSFSFINELSLARSEGSYKFLSDLVDL